MIVFALEEQKKQLAGTTVHKLFQSHIYLIYADIRTFRRSITPPRNSAFISTNMKLSLSYFF
ncbi:MAG: hypothetical protein E7222_14635 [Clostridiales bacterium]|nr:hypothetical protein [Clostridiales bacterium]